MTDALASKMEKVALENTFVTGLDSEAKSSSRVYLLIPVPGYVEPEEDEDEPVAPGPTKESHHVLWLSGAYPAVLERVKACDQETKKLAAELAATKKNKDVSQKFLSLLALTREMADDSSWFGEEGGAKLARDLGNLWKKAVLNKNDEKIGITAEGRAVLYTYLTTAETQFEDDIFDWMPKKEKKRQNSSQTSGDNDDDVGQF